MIAAPADDVVDDDDAAVARQLHRPAEVVGRGRLVGVDEDEVERLVAARAPAANRSRAPTRTSTISDNPARAMFARATPACFGSNSSETSRPPAGSARASQIVL